MKFKEGVDLPRIFPEYVYSDEQIKALQDKLFEGLKEVHKLCTKNNIQYMLSGGSCLGAVRHNDFIPWDDDADIMMFPEAWEKLKEQIRANSNMFRVYDDDDEINSYKIRKLYIKNTRVVGFRTQNTLRDKGLWIDVFLFENCPKNKLVRKIRGKCHDLLVSALGYKEIYKYPSTLILKKIKQNKDMSRWYNTRRFAGFFTNIFTRKFYINRIRKLERYKKETGLICIPSAKKYESEIFSRENFYETIDCKFRNEIFKIPKEYDKYMKNLYGDYMQIPPENKREMHMGIELNLNYKE